MRADLVNVGAVADIMIMRHGTRLIEMLQAVFEILKFFGHEEVELSALIILDGVQNALVAIAAAEVKACSLG